MTGNIHSSHKQHQTILYLQFAGAPKVQPHTHGENMQNP